MKRWSLRKQVAVLLTASLVIIQSINLGLALDQRRSGGREAVADIAAARLADRLTEPDRNLRRPRPSSLSAGAGTRDLALEAGITERLASDFGFSNVDVRAVWRGSGRNGRARLRVSAQGEQGERVSVVVRGPVSIRPLLASLIGQTFIILLALLLPLLWLLGRATRPLGALTQAAQDWRPGDKATPLYVVGPSDVRALIVAFDNLRDRVEQMLSEKDVMLGAIGHDLRTPLAALRLEVEGINEDDVREPMIDSLDRLAEELESILALARTARALPTRVPIDLAALLQKVVDGRDAVTLEVAATATTLGDYAALRRALANLVDNAEWYGAQAYVTLAVEEFEAIVRITDEGPGLPVTDLARAGEPFVRFEPSRNRATGGHGLGLAIAKATVERHGGTLILANRTIGGLEVTVRLPFESAN